MFKRVSRAAGVLFLLIAASGCGGGGTAPAVTTGFSDAGAAPDGGPPPPGKKALAASKVGSGVVRSTPAGIDCGASCAATFDSGTNISLTAVANPGWAFVGWGGACAVTVPGIPGPCSLSLGADSTVSATFREVPPQPVPHHRVEVARPGDGKGRVTSNPGGIDCGSTCSASFADGTVVALTATPEPGSQFAGWAGACSGKGGCTLTVSGGDKAAAATFSLVPAPDDCAGLSPGALPAMRTYRQTYSTGSSADFCKGLPIGNGDGVVGMLAFQGFGHPTYTLLDGRGQPLGSIALWHGQAWPDPQGFIGYSGNSAQQVTWVASWTDTGNQAGSASVNGDAQFASDPNGGLFAVGRLTQGSTEVVPPPDPVVQLFNADGSIRWGPLPLGTKAPVLGAGVDLLGRALVLLDGGPGNVDAIWFGETGANLTGTFRVLSNVQPGRLTWFENSPLIGGGLALRRVDAQTDPYFSERRTSRWVAVLPSGVARVDAVPPWLAQRPDTNMTLARSKRAYAFTPWAADVASCGQQAEIVSRAGTSCGKADFPVDAAACTTRELRVGLDGTVMQMLPASREENQPPGSTVFTCTLRYWPAALR